MAPWKWIGGTLAVTLALVWLVYGASVVRTLLVRSVILVALIAIAVAVPLLVFRRL